MESAATDGPWGNEYATSRSSISKRRVVVLEFCPSHSRGAFRTSWEAQDKAREEHHL